MQIEVKDVGFGYSPYPHELSRSAVSLAAKGLYAVYGSFVSAADPTAYPSTGHMCRLCGLNEKTFWKYKRELLTSGWISEEQRHRENGQYTSLLITRYYSPSMNPFFTVKSTVHQKTERRKTERQKPAPQEQESIPTTKNHTQTSAACVSSGRELTPDEKECIEWTIAEGIRKGTVKSVAGLRVTLARAAQGGTLNMADFEAWKGVRAKSDQVSKELLDQVDTWAEEAKSNPITPAFLAEQKRKFPALFSGSRNSA